MIYIINGYAESGKDTFVDLVRQSLKVVPVINISSVGQIRSIAQDYFGWDGVTKDTKTRQLLSDLKNLQTAYCDGPFNFMCNQIDFCFDGSVIFVHIREIDEIRKMVDRYPDAKTILIYRPDFEKDVINDIYNYRYDLNIFNDGTLEDLGMKAKHFIHTEELVPDK